MSNVSLSGSFAFFASSSSQNTSGVMIGAVSVNSSASSFLSNCSVDVLAQTSGDSIVGGLVGGYDGLYVTDSSFSFVVSNISAFGTVFATGGPFKFGVSLKNVAFA